MTRHSTTFLAVLIALVPSALLAQTATKCLLDLAESGGTRTVTTGQQLDFVVCNALPSADYSFTVVKKSGKLLPELDFQGALELGDALNRLNTLKDVMCPKLLSDLDAKIFSSTSEPPLRGEIQRIRGQADTQLPQDKREPCRQLINAFVSRTTERQLGSYQIGEGEEVRVDVERVGPGGQVESSWTFTFTTGSERRWLIHYGFAFLPDQDEHFFAKSIEVEGDDDGAFQITEQADREDNDFEPVVTFTYQPDSLRPRPWMPKFTAGVGADIDERLVFAGLSWVVGDNVNLFVGAAGQRQKRLRGTYEPGQILQASVEADQLVEDTFDVNVIFGVGLRFNSNPFKKQQTQNNGGQNGSGTTGNQGTGTPPAGADVPTGGN